MSMGFIGKLPGKTPGATMASTLYTDIKKWKDGKPGSLFCRPREGLFGLREWTKDKELSHLVEDADGSSVPASSLGRFRPTIRTPPAALRSTTDRPDPARSDDASLPAAAERDDNDKDAELLLLLGAAGDDSNNDDDDTDDARQSDRGAKRAKREDSEADGRGTAAAAAAAAGRDASEERACAPLARARIRARCVDVDADGGHRGCALAATCEPLRRSGRDVGRRSSPPTQNFGTRCFARGVSFR